MKLRKALATGAFIGLCVTGAADAKKKSQPLSDPPIDAAQFEWSTKPGDNAIEGEAMVRTRGGDVKTCAGLAVSVLPVTAYTDLYASRAFRSTQAGIYVPPLFGKPVNLAPEASPFVRAKRCNSQGQFSFKGLPDGTYYVVAKVTWEAPTRYGLVTQGGDVMQRVELRGGETKELTVTQ
jgi:hypothetical protein